MTSDLRRTAARAGNHDGLRAAARIGYAVTGLVHLLLAWLAVQLAWGSSGTRADESGAFATLASSGPGRVALWVCVAGFAGLALWQLTEAVVGSRRASERARAAAKCAVYAVLAVLAFQFASGSGGSGSGGSGSGGGQTGDVTAGLMGHTWGALVVGAAGLVLIGVGVYHAVKGWTCRFLGDLVSHPGRYAVLAGRIGYVAKGVALGTVGVLFGIAALRNDPEEATGLDQALRTLLDAPFGAGLLTAVGVGLAAYGLYSFARARYARL